ncbi:unnamed protein product, partial [Mesorhabditis belari]|uniref:Uncharacterized protein n=1 Tax=Mesorhabditis belari TaxID=2138241 RepID=A0AAF3EFY5_9BILA
MFSPSPEEEERGPLTLPKEEPSQFDPSTGLGAGPQSQNNNSLALNQNWLFLTKDQWPANSPDLNPLDFSVWGFMEEQLRNRKINNLNDLRQELIKIWNDLDANYLRRTVDSVKKRIEACIKADGGHFENFL